MASGDVKEMIAQKLYADKTAYITKLFKTNGIYYITEAAIEVHQRDEWHTFQVMPRQNFTVNAVGYF